VPMSAGPERLNVAPGRVWPSLSTIWPEIAPVCLWANAGETSAATRSKASNGLRGRAIIFPSLWGLSYIHGANAYYANLVPYRQLPGGPYRFLSLEWRIETRGERQPLFRASWSLAQAAAPIKPASLPRLALSIEQQPNDALQDRR